MTIEELKNNIETGKVTSESIAFKYTDSPFLAEQYVHAIAKLLGKRINLVDNTNELEPRGSVFLGEGNFNLLMTDKLENVGYLPKENAFIIAKTYKNCSMPIMECPKLLDWQIKDYVYTQVEGVATEKLDKLISMCNNNMYRIQREVDKLLLFTKDERPFIFDDFMREGVFSDLSNHTIFDFTDAIIKKDLKKLDMLYKEIDNIDCEPLALLNILWKQFRKVITVQMHPNPTESDTGIPSKQIWAIRKYSTGFYSKEQLYKAYELLTGLDRRIKEGNFPMDNRGATFLRDYITTQLLTM